MLLSDKENSIIKVEGVDHYPFNTIKNDVLIRDKNKHIRNSDEIYVFEKQVTIPYTDAADSNYYPIFYVAEVQCFLMEAKMRHGATGGASAAVNVIKIPSGTAKSAGQSMLASAFDLTATANTVQSRTISTSSVGVSQLSPGDAMGLRPGGTLTGAQEVCVTVLLGVMARDLPTGSNV